MDHAAHKILESATHRSLHAIGFSRSSSQASLVLTDLLSRYLTLLSGTCAKYAQHAGRTSLSPHDAFNVLDELGVSVEELKEYCATEGREMERYSIRSVYLNEFKTQLADGLRQDTDDAIPLVYAPLETPLVSEDEDDEEEAEDRMDVDGPQLDATEAEQNILGPATVPLTRKDEPPIPRAASPPPPLPLSPISNPSSPARKRLRMANWKPPSHVPDFLPPFPTVEEPESRPQSPQIPPLQLPPTNVEASSKVDKPPSPPPQSQAIASSDYLAQVPYTESTLSSAPEWHLPQPPPQPPLGSATTVSSRLNRLPTPQTEPSLIKAYHHILTHPPPQHHPANPARHRVAMALLFQTQTEPRWDPPDTLFSAVAPCLPRLSVIAPTHPVPTGKPDVKAGKDSEPKLPVTQGRHVAPPERISTLVSQQTSRIPELARGVLPPAILTRTSRLSHPPMLLRGSQKLVYGNPVPAPWNSAPATSGAGKDGAQVNGKDDEAHSKPVIPDANLFATWEAETKSFKTSLAPPPRNRMRMGSIQSNTGVTLSLNRSRMGKGA